MMQGHGKGFAQQVLIAAHRPGLFENRAEGSTHRVETRRSSRTDLDYVRCVDALSCHGVGSAAGSAQRPASAKTNTIESQPNRCRQRASMAATILANDRTHRASSSRNWWARLRFGKTA
jgi:hypothetical protein